jgi:hypothetical protein
MITLALWTLVAFAAPAAAQVRQAIEYKLTSYWDDFGDYSNDAYFVTSFPEEVASLDLSVQSGAIVLTGEVFSVWSGPAPGALPTCRFWSPTFHSHFFTPYEAECATLQADANWLYEGIAFYLQLPDSSGSCASGTTPLYRLYNKSMGVPHHRLTTSTSTLDGMLGEGWVFEGDRRTRAFACVPNTMPP